MKSLIAWLLTFTIPNALSRIHLIASTAQRQHPSPVIVKSITPDPFVMLEFIIPNKLQQQQALRFVCEGEAGLSGARGGKDDDGDEAPCTAAPHSPPARLLLRRGLDVL